MKNGPLHLWRLHPLPVVELDVRPPVSIGRHPQCSLSLPDSDASRSHAVLDVDSDGGLRLSDQGSRNGTYVNGGRIGVQTLVGGDVIRIGQTLLWLGPASSFRDVSRRFFAKHGASATAVRFYGELGSGRRSLAKMYHAYCGVGGSIVVVEEDAPDALLAASATGTLVIIGAREPERILRRAPRKKLRLVFVDAASPGDEDVPELCVPPLRERLDELPGALESLVSPAKPTWNTDFLEALACHPFPLNFAELAATCRPFANGEVPIDIAQLPRSTRAQLVERRSSSAAEVSRDTLDDALTRHRGNVRRVGQELGVPRGQLYRLLASFGLNPDLYRGLQSPLVSFAPEDPSEERRTAE